MIRHRPFGIGHVYRLEPDQRVPPCPLAGEPFELRATTGADITALRLELTVDGHLTSLPVEPAAFDRTAGTAADSGHLAAAAAREVGRGRRAWSVRIGPLAAGARVSYRFVDDSGRQATRTFNLGMSAWGPTGGRLVVDPVGGAQPDRLVPGSAAWLSDGRAPSRLRFALRLADGEHVVGFGERFDHLDQRGRRLDAVVYEQYKGQGARTYLPMPFAIVVGRDGWGFHVATSRRTWYDVGATDPDRLWIEVDLDPDGPGPDQRRRGGRPPTTAGPEVRLELFAGRPAEVLDAFLDRVGRPRVPPAWVFRPWMSANEWNTQAQVAAEVERTFELGIPAGVVVIEAWSDETTFAAFRDACYEPHPDGAPHRLADFTFPPDGAWPDPKGLVDALHARDVRVLLWQVPLLRTGVAAGVQARAGAQARLAATVQVRADRDVMVRHGYAVLRADGRPYRNRGWWFPGALMPDFTSDEARAWWLAKRRYLVEEIGIDGFKTDGGEHAWGHDLRYADGSGGAETNNRYPVLYAAAYHELMESCGREPVTFSRAGFTGAATVPCHWAGDEDSTWEAFRASITAGLTAGASGVVAWGWDLAGFSGEIPGAELYIRATEMACFCPIMQYHSEYNHHRRPSRDRTPWNIAERTGNPRVIPTFRRYAQLHDRLVPYLAEQARRSAETGTPLMRALCFDWPDDPAIWGFPHEYLLGDDLLVAPVASPGVSGLEVYLPAGEWTDAWTGEESGGARAVHVPAPLERIPAFVRGSAATDARARELLDVLGLIEAAA